MFNLTYNQTEISGKDNFMLINFAKNMVNSKSWQDWRWANIRDYSFNKVLMAKFCISDTKKGTNV